MTDLSTASRAYLSVSHACILALTLFTSKAMKIKQHISNLRLLKYYVPLRVRPLVIFAK